MTETWGHSMFDQSGNRQHEIDLTVPSPRPTSEMSEQEWAGAEQEVEARWPKQGGRPS